MLDAIEPNGIAVMHPEEIARAGLVAGAVAVIETRRGRIEAMPEVSPDFRTFTVRLRRGTFFADDPAFGGQRREVTAADVVSTVGISI